MVIISVGEVREKDERSIHCQGLHLRFSERITGFVILLCKLHMFCYVHVKYYVIKKI